VGKPPRAATAAECAAKQKRRVSELVAALALVGAKLDPVLRHGRGYGFVDHPHHEGERVVAVCSAYGLKTFSSRSEFTAFPAEEFNKVFINDVGWPQLQLDKRDVLDNE